MSKRCELCGRKAMTANNRSHSLRATKRKQHLNLQTKTIGGKKIKVCTSCIRTLNKKQAV